MSHGGVRKKLSETKIRKIMKGLSDGLSIAAIAEAVSVSQTTVYNYKAKLEQITTTQKAMAARAKREATKLASVLLAPVVKREAPCNEFCPGRVVITADHHRQIVADLDQEIEQLQALRSYHKRKAAELDTE